MKCPRRHARRGVQGAARGAEGQQIVRVSEQPGPRGAPPGAVPVGQRLGLQPRHVHLRGHSVAHALQPRQSSSASCRPSSARPPSSRPSIAARSSTARPRVAWRSSRSGLVAGAHGGAGRAAGAVAVARLGGAGQPALGREVDRRPPRRGAAATRASWSPASSGSGSVSTPGLSSRPGSRRSLRPPEGRDRLRRVHARQQLSGRGRRRAPRTATRRAPPGRRSPRHRRSGAVAPGSPGPSAAGCAGSRRWRGRTRPRSALAVQDPPDHRAQAGSARRHRGVLDERERLRVARAGGRRSPRWRPMPAGRTAHTAAWPGPSAPHRAPGGPAGPPRPPPGGRWRPPAARPGVGVERGGAHQLDGRRPGLQRPQRRLQRGVHGVERHERQPARGGRGTRPSSAPRITASVPSEPQTSRGQSGSGPPSASRA